MTIAFALFKKFWPYIIIGFLVFSLVGMTNLYLGKRDELSVMVTRYNAFVGATEVIGKQAEANKRAEEAQHEKNLQQVKEDHENQIPQIRDNAVANYIAAHPTSVRHGTAASSGSGSVRGDGSGIKLDDGASCEQVLDTTLIQDAADDAAKVGAWIEYCQLNHCPVRVSPSTP